MIGDILKGAFRVVGSIVVAVAKDATDVEKFEKRYESERKKLERELQKKK